MFTTIIACDTFELISMLGNIPTGFSLLASSVSQGLRERPVGNMAQQRLPKQDSVYMSLAQVGNVYYYYSM